MACTGCRPRSRFGSIVSVQNGATYWGRYQSLLVEDGAALARVVDYIHLNAVRAGIVSAEPVADFRWSSLARFVKGPRPEWLSPMRWLPELGLKDTAGDWTRYVAELVALAGNPEEQQKRGFDELTRTWAIGTAEWKQSVARTHSHRAIELDLPQSETCTLKEERWKAILEAELRHHGKDAHNLAQASKSARWKVEIALIC